MMIKKNEFVKWGLYIVLALIWGSSFELMKIGLYQNNDFNKPVLSAYQVAAFRMLFAGLVMLPWGIKAFQEIPKTKRNFAIFSGFLGSFFPAFLFCIAETKLDGSFAGALNSLTPIFVLLIGFLFFQLKPTSMQVLGILVSFSGSILLFFSKSGKTGDLLYVGLIVLATIMYGLNVNMVVKNLKEVSSTKIAALAFSFLTIPSGIILLFTKAHSLDFGSPIIIKSVVASAVLGLMGTAVASILFYVLMKKAGAVFASAVTYGIPFVAMFWDVMHKTTMSVWVWVSLGIILCGIYITSIKRKVQ